jgi:glutathione S-transferase
MPNTIIIGTRRYSSWSLRGWLAVRLSGLTAEEQVIPLQDGMTEALRELTPTGLVPALRVDGAIIWDTMAIAEFCAEYQPALWPADRMRRAVARSVAAEMHAGFAPLRRALPMNLGRSLTTPELAPDVRADLARIEQVWSECLTASGGPFLFGAFPTIPDAMYAPVVTRFLSYGVPLSNTAVAYCRTVREWALVDHWYRLAAVEPESWRLAKYE